MIPALLASMGDLQVFGDPVSHTVHTYTALQVPGRKLNAKVIDVVVLSQSSKYGAYEICRERRIILKDYRYTAFAVLYTCIVLFMSSTWHALHLHESKNTP